MCGRCLELRYEGRPAGSTIEEMLELAKMVDNDLHTYQQYQDFILPTLTNHGGCQSCINKVMNYLASI